MKKVLSIIMALSLMFALSACNIKDVTKMATVGNESVSKGIFNFYLYTEGKSMAVSAAQNAGVVLTEESDQKTWETVKIGEVSAADYAIDYAKQRVKEILVLKAVAVRDGLTLAEEDKAQMTARKNEIIDQFGGRYNYEQAFADGGFTLEDVEEIIELETYAQKAIVKYFGNGVTDGEIKVSDEAIKKVLQDEYIMAKHILISNSIPEVKEGEKAMTAEEADAAAKTKAEDLIKKIDGGANFDSLMKENTEDKNAETGELNGENGYFFTKGQMVLPFETEAFALEVGAVSKAPVKTDYGYHIIKRLESPTEGEEYEAAYNNVKAQKAEELLETEIEKWATELGFKFNEKAISNVKIVK